MADGLHTDLDENHQGVSMGFFTHAPKMGAKKFFHIFLMFWVGTVKANPEVYVPSNLDAPTHFVISLTRLNRPTIVDAYLAVDAANKSRSIDNQIQFVLLVPEVFESVWLANDLDFEKQDVLDAVVRIQKELQSKLNVDELKNWNVVKKQYLQYSWLQDIGFPFYFREGNDKPWSAAFLDVNKSQNDDDLPLEPWSVFSSDINDKGRAMENADFATIALNNFFGWKSFRMPILTEWDIEVEQTPPGNQGGNIDSLPDGTVYVGSTFPPEALPFIAQNMKQDPLVLDTSFLQVGHVDELFAVIPSNNEFGFTILYADPLEGMVLARGTGYDGGLLEDERDNLENALRYYANNPSAELSMNFRDYDLSRELPRYGAGELPKHPILSFLKVQKAINARKIIEQNLELLAKALKNKYPGFQREMFLPVPVVVDFSTEVDFTQVSPDGFEYIFFTTPTPNLVVLDNHLLIPQFTNVDGTLAERLKDITWRRLRENGYDDSQLHEIDVTSYHMGMGSIHCASLVKRQLSN